MVTYREGHWSPGTIDRVFSPGRIKMSSKDKLELVLVGWRSDMKKTNIQPLSILIFAC